MTTQHENEKQTRSPRELRRHAIAILIYLVAYYVFSYPAFHTLTTHLMADGGDGLQNFWNNWWVRHAVSNWQNPWYTDFLYAPHGITLVGATLNPFNGLATVPLCWFVNPITAYNLMLIFAFVAGGYTAFLLAKEVTGAWWPSVFAGAVFTFSPYHFGHALGHMSLVSLQWLPFFLWAWIRLLRQPSHRRALVSALALFLNLLCDYYYTFYSILGGALLFVHYMWASRRPLFFLERGALPALFTFVVVCLLSCGPILGSLLFQQIDDPFLGSHPAHLHNNDLFALFVPGSYWRFADLTEAYWRLHPDFSHVDQSYLGLTVVFLSVYALVLSRRYGQGRDALGWLILGAVFFLLSLGPNLLVLGERYLDVPMPYDLLLTALPMLDLGGMPIRMAMMTGLAAAVLAAFGAKYAWQRVPAAKALIVPFLALWGFEIWPVPQVLLRPEYPPVIYKLKELPDGIVAGTGHLLRGPEYSTWLLYQTLFEKPMVNGYVARVSGSRMAYREQQANLTREGRYAELMRLCDASYLILERGIDPEMAEQGLKLIGSDSLFDLYVPADSKFEDMRVTVDVRRGPDRITVNCKRKQSAGRDFVFAFSMSKGPPKDFQDHVLPLVRDALFEMSMVKDNPVFDNWGVVDENGVATAKIDTTRMIKPTDEIWFCLVVLETKDPLRVSWISEPRKLELRR